MNERIGIIGAGVVGTAIGVVLHGKGYEITGVHDVKSESTRQIVERIGCTAYTSPQEVSRSADILFITTSDAAIKEVVNILAQGKSFKDNQVIIHMSGALSSEVLKEAKAFGSQVLSLHPLQSFASVDGAIENLPGSVFSIEGDKSAFNTAIRIVESLDGEHFFLETAAKPLYHAGACVVSNYLVAIAYMGAALLEVTGIPRNAALKALLPLIRGTVNNLDNIGAPGALTGPIARGDWQTVLQHLESLSELAPEYKRLYSLLGSYTAQVALEKGTINLTQKNRFDEIFEKP
ncbi:MAG: Rossmann-like and DUF2520 domain-containing protein [Syntrophomonadaceae bacterium]|jgi:predicted short-subunit dehydrogenase-like oxidoreductase (DUF2520 family)